MTQAELTEQDWQIRLFIFDFFLEQERPPTYQETARKFSLADEEARQCFERLNQNHRIFLEPGTRVIRMAHPFSAVATPYRVAAGIGPPKGHRIRTRGGLRRGVASASSSRRH